MIKIEDYVRLLNVINYYGLDGHEVYPQKHEGLRMCTPREMCILALDFYNDYYDEVIEYFSADYLTNYSTEQIEDYLFFVSFKERLQQELYKDLYDYLSSLSHIERVKKLATIYGFITALSNDSISQQELDNLTTDLTIHQGVNYKDNWTVLSTIKGIEKSIILANKLIDTYSTKVELNEESVQTLRDLQKFVK